MKAMGCLRARIFVKKKSDIIKEDAIKKRLEMLLSEHFSLMFEVDPWQVSCSYCS